MQPKKIMVLHENGQFNYDDIEIILQLALLDCEIMALENNIRGKFPEDDWREDR